MVSVTDEDENDLLVTNVRVKVLQVLEGGVLASEFVGTLHKGHRNMRTTTSKTVEHPITGKAVSKVIDVSMSKVPISELVRDDLCFIVGNTLNLTDGQILRVESMKLRGRYQYVDVRGASRTVRRYFVE